VLSIDILYSLTKLRFAKHRKVTTGRDLGDGRHENFAASEKDH